MYAVNGTAGAEVLSKNSSAEIAEWCNENGLDVKISSHRVKANRAMQQKKRDKLFAEAQAEESTMVPLSDAYTQELFTDIISAVVRFCYGESQPLPASEASETATPPATVSQEDFVTWPSNVQFVGVIPTKKSKDTIKEPASDIPSMVEGKSRNVTVNNEAPSMTEESPNAAVSNEAPSMTEDYKGWLKHQTLRYQKGKK